MKKHKIGDKVLALTNPGYPSSQPRKKGNIYIVQDTSYCCKCGIQSINIGPKLDLKKFSNCVECRCGNIQDALFLCWTDSNHFAKVDDLEKEMQEAVKKEDYETATVIRDANIMLNEKSTVKE